MLSDTHRALLAHLRSCSSMLTVRPCTVTIGGEQWPAAYYQQEREAPAGCRNPGRYVQTAIYVVGPLPATYKKAKTYMEAGLRGHRICFPFAEPHEGAPREWYVAGGMYEPPAPEYAQYHPLGCWFQLMPWYIANCPQERIDDCYRYGKDGPYMPRREYQRVPMTVQWLNE